MSAVQRRLARFNRTFANRFVGPVLTRMPGFGAVVHTGRKSGRAYRTPVKVFKRGPHYVMSLPYGPQSDWVRNTLAMRRLRTAHPSTAHPPAPAARVHRPAAGRRTGPAPAPAAPLQGLRLHRTAPPRHTGHRVGPTMTLPA